MQRPVDVNNDERNEMEEIKSISKPNSIGTQITQKKMMIADFILNEFYY